MSDWQLHNYEERAASRLTSYPKRVGQPGEILKSLVSPLNDLEAAFKRIYDTYDIYTATGIELDRFGEYVDEKRNGRDDEDFRLAILAKKFSSNGSGTASDIIRLAQAVTTNAATSLITHFPAAFVLHVSGPMIPNTINETIQAATVAGVRSYVTHDYGTGCFKLAGIDTSQGVAMRTGEDEALGVGPDQAMGINKGSSVMGGSKLGTVLQTTFGEDAVIQALNKEGSPADLSTINNDVIIAGTDAYRQSGAPAMLGGAFTKKG